MRKSAIAGARPSTWHPAGDRRLAGCSMPGLQNARAAKLRLAVHGRAAGACHPTVCRRGALLAAESACNIRQTRPVLAGACAGRRGARGGRLHKRAARARLRDRRGACVVGHVVVQVERGERARVRHQLCDRVAGRDGAAHVLEGQLLQARLPHAPAAPSAGHAVTRH